jgi:hypothetical protein
MHRTRNAAYGQPYRGFESLPLRQPNKISVLADIAATAATVIGDNLIDHGRWERLKSDNGIDPSGML